jgi:hypothetical protein
MHISSSLLVLATTTSATILTARQNNGTDEEAYLAKVCSPEVSSGPLPPCVSIQNIESQCQPNNTTPLGLSAHAQCICGGSFFSDWEGCLACQTVHGARSPPVAEVFLSILTTASQALCTGTPTAPFASIFESVRATAGAEEAAQGVTASDRYPDQTAVSLYYTATQIVQGPGVIRGSATQATNTRNVVPTDEVSTGGLLETLSSTGARTTSSRNTGTGASAATGSSTSSSVSGARETGAWMGALGVIAGGAVMAAL